MTAVLVLIAGLATSAATVGAQPTDQTGSAPQTSCAQMRALDLARFSTAPAYVESATEISADSNTLGSWPACRLTGTIAPQVQFEILLPTQTWQGRYLQTGCGGYCGSVSINAPAADGCVPLTDGTFAVASSNEGHHGLGGFNAAFGTDPQLRVDFGYASDHKLAVVAKRLIKSFYGRATEHSYFDGCSQGGHQGLTEAQRYPEDFDGIVSGAPASILTALNVWYQGWNARANVDGKGQPIIALDDLQPLHSAVVNQCDSDDGTKDGLLADPRSCDFDPSSLVCTGSARSADFCLTSEQAGALRKLYEGPRDGKGHLMYPGWQLPGSELNWENWIVPRSQGPTITEQIATNTLRFMVHDSPRPQATLDDLEFTQAEFKKITDANEGIYNATNPDLTRFRDRGGKLILWHGWADQAISPMGTVAYFQAVQDAMDGPQRTAQFARLYMLPGVAHCRGGEGPDSFDALGAVVRWVEKGKAPSALITRQIAKNGDTTATRPVYPYPYIAVNTTGGPNTSASSFRPRLPSVHHDDRVDWLGTFMSGYEKECTWKGQRWSCTPSKSS